MKCYLDDFNPHKIIIKDNVIISYCVKFTAHGRGIGKNSIITIEDGAYIGMGAMLISGKEGIVIGKKSVIGAGSIVIKSVPDDVLVAGNPARPLNNF